MDSFPLVGFSAETCFLSRSASPASMEELGVAAATPSSPSFASKTFEGISSSLAMSYILIFAK
jgi:hypothetical protein